MTTVNINRAGSIGIKFNRTSSGVLTQTKDAIQIHQPISYNRLQDLSDVDVSNPQDGETLVYNEDTNKYESRELELGDLSDTVDGGEF